MIIDPSPCLPITGKTMSPQDIISKVSTSFHKALDSKDIFFFPSTITKHVELGVEVRELAPIV